MLKGQEIHTNTQTSARPLETPSPLETPRLLQDLEFEPREQALPRIRTSRQALFDRKSPNGLDGLAFLQTKRLGFEGKERKNVRVNTGTNSEVEARGGCVLRGHLLSHKETERDLEEVIARDREESGETAKRTEKDRKRAQSADIGGPKLAAVQKLARVLESANIGLGRG